MKELSRLHVTFSGRVQGVGFRAFISHVAVRYDLTGWVENMSDGTVCAEFQGPRENIDMLLAQAASPDHRWINVEHISVEKLPPDPYERCFSVRG